MTRVNLRNLDTLAFRFPGRDGAQLTGHAIYAEPVDKTDPLGPVKQVGDDDEGFSCVDDVARIGLVYLEQFEKTGSALWKEKAVEAVRFCLNLEDGQGCFYNFVERDGRVNEGGPTSSPGLNWWTARAFWALSRAERVLGEDSPLGPAIAASRGRTLERLRSCGGSLVDNSGAITSIFALGLLEKNDDPALLTRYCDAMAALEVPESHPLLGGLHLSSLGDRSTVHLYGNHQAGVLAEAGHRCGRADWVESARREADAYPRMLTSFQLPFAYSPAPEPTPQIAYAAETTIANLQAVYRATGEERYSELAGLFATWFAGANVSGKAVYHPETGRAFDGVDPQGVSLNSGAESNVEAQLAMSALEGTPGERLAGFGQVEAFVGEQVREVAVVAGHPTQVVRTLNGGHTRSNWVLGAGDVLSSGRGVLVWKGEALTVDPDGAGPLPALRVASEGPGWQATPLSGSPTLSGAGVVVDSLVEQPEHQFRSWKDGPRLDVDSAGWRISG